VHTGAVFALLQGARACDAQRTGRGWRRPELAHNERRQCV